MPFLDLLHFGTGDQAWHYAVFSFVAIMGTLQVVAARFDRQELVWVEGRNGMLLGALVVAAGFIWFFWVDGEIFTPGLAGGELFVLFSVAFAAAVPFCRAVALVLHHVRSLGPVAARPRREKEPLL